MNYKTYGQLNSPTIVINSQLDIDKLFSNFITSLTSLNISPLLIIPLIIPCILFTMKSSTQQAFCCRSRHADPHGPRWTGMTRIEMFASNYGYGYHYHIYISVNMYILYTYLHYIH